MYEVWAIGWHRLWLVGHTQVRVGDAVLCSCGRVWHLHGIPEEAYLFPWMRFPDPKD